MTLGYLISNNIDDKNKPTSSQQSRHNNTINESANNQQMK